MENSGGFGRKTAMVSSRWRIASAAGELLLWLALNGEQWLLSTGNDNGWLLMKNSGGVQMENVSGGLQMENCIIRL